LGKSLGAILTIGAAVAVNAIPGVGQAISGALVGTLGTVGTAVFQGLQLSLAMAGLQSAGGLLGLGPNIGKPDTASVPFKPPGASGKLFEPADWSGNAI
jgi:hypothetical protein